MQLASTKTLDQDPELPAEWVKWIPERLGWLCPRAAIVFAARPFLRVLPCYGMAPRQGYDGPALDRLWELLLASTRLVSDFCVSPTPTTGLRKQALDLGGAYGKISVDSGLEGLGPIPYAIGSAASRLVVAVRNGLERSESEALRKGAELGITYAAKAISLAYTGSEGEREVRTFRVAAENDYPPLFAHPARLGLAIGENGPAGPLWSDVRGTVPEWYCRVREWLYLTSSGEEWQNLFGMRRKDGPPGRSDPALQQAFDAFDGMKLPRPPLTKLSDLTPAEGMQALRDLARYLDGVEKPMAAAVRLLLRDLDGKSFQSFPQTKEFVDSLQALLDRIGYAVECPKCEEPGRLEASAPATAVHGSIRIRHPGRTNHGNRTTVSNFKLRRVERT